MAYFGRVLIVDDFELMRDAVELVLRRKGFLPECAKSGVEAWSHLQNGDFALVVTDLIMPGIDGVELIRKIRTFFPDTRIIAMTGHGVELLEEARAAGANAALAKPFSPTEMFAACGRTLATRN